MLLIHLATITSLMYKNGMFARSLALRILAVNLIIVVLPVVIFLLAFAGIEYEKEISTNIQRLKNDTFLRASYLKQIVEDQFTSLDFVAGMVDLNRPEAVDNLDAALHRLNLGVIYPLAAFFVRTPDDHYIVKYTTSAKEIGRDLTYRGYIQPAVANGYYAYLAYDDLTLVKQFFILKAIHSRVNYDLLGVLLFSSPAQIFLDTLTEDKYFSHGETISLLTTDKVVFASSDDNLVLASFAPVSDSRREEIKANKQFGSTQVPTRTIELKPYSDMSNVFQWKEEGHTHIAFMAPVLSESFYILMDVDQEAVAKPYRQAMLLTVIVLFVITLVSCCITIGIGYLLSMTFQELINVVDKVAKGDLSARYKSRFFGFEINKAGSALNNMLGRLGEETKQAEAELVKTAAISQQIRIGKDIQLSLMTQNIPTSKSLDIGILARSAWDMSGEFYDIFTQQNTLFIILSHSSQKGLSPCLFSFDLRSILRSFTTVYSDLSQILAKANSLFHKDLQNTSMVVRTFIGRWDGDSSTLNYAFASFSFGFVRFPDGKIEALAGFQGTIGAQAKTSFPNQTLSLDSGSVVVIYSPGIIELQNRFGHFYGEEGLRAIVDKKALLGAQEIAQEIETDLIRFGAGSTQAEDMTMIILKVKGKKGYV